MTRILIMAGEASGDQHGAALATALKAARPDVELLGLGGPRMQAAGVELLEGIERLDIIGLPSFAELRQALRTFRALSERLKALRLDAVVLIDNPGLNLRLARVAKRAGHRVVYYIAPQLWAWNRRRIEVIKQYVDHVLVILPFEKAIYDAAGVRCTFVGHPLLDEAGSGVDRAEARDRLGVEPDALTVGLLPGSRQREVRTLLPIMLAAAEQLAARHGDGRRLTFLLGQAASLPADVVDGLIARSPVPVMIGRDSAWEVMAASDMLFVASGTATLQAALVGTPMAIVYRTTLASYLFVRAVIRVRWIGLANLVAERAIAPELLQWDCTPERLAAEAQRVLSDPQALAAARRAASQASQELRHKLGERGASQRAARAILDQCGA